MRLVQRRDADTIPFNAVALVVMDRRPYFFLSSNTYSYSRPDDSVYLLSGLTSVATGEFPPSRYLCQQTHGPDGPLGSLKITIFHCCWIASLEQSTSPLTKFSTCPL